MIVTYTILCFTVTSICFARLHIIGANSLRLNETNNLIEKCSTYFKESKWFYIFITKNDKTQQYRLIIQLITKETNFI